MTARTGMVAVMHYLGMKPGGEVKILADGTEKKVEGFSVGWKNLTQQDKEDLKNGIGSYDDETGEVTGSLTYGD